MTAPRAPLRRPAVARRRGQPLMVLAAVMVGWTVLRLATWADPLAAVTEREMPDAATPLVGNLTTGTAARAQASATPAAPLASLPDLPRSLANPPAKPLASPLAAPLPVPVQMPAPMPLPSPLPQPTLADPATAQPTTRPAPTALRTAVGHTMLLAAAFSQMELPPHLAALFQARSGPLTVPQPVAPAPPPPAATTHQGSRWSLDGWVLWRDDTTTPLTTGRPSYGRSQAGAVARFALAPASGHAPQAYLRGSTALQGAREQAAAFGLAARPLPRVPLRAAVEARATHGDDGTRLRPAAYLVTELAPQDLPGGLRAEAYGQAGYIAGRGHTAFADGQVRVDRSVVLAEDFDLRAGAAAWGGAQRQAARLDVGPTASVSFRLGAARGRLAADYRLRLAGDAQPASGPALTLSAGF